MTPESVTDELVAAEIAAAQTLLEASLEYDAITIVLPDGKGGVTAYDVSRAGVEVRPLWSNRERVRVGWREFAVLAVWLLLSCLMVLGVAGVTLLVCG